MGWIDDIRIKGASVRLTDEMFFAEALREMDSGVRRDGLWAQALAESNFDENKAKALYLKLRVQALRDELQMAQRERASELLVQTPTTSWESGVTLREESRVESKPTTFAESCKGWFISLLVAIASFIPHLVCPPISVAPVCTKMMPVIVLFEFCAVIVVLVWTLGLILRVITIAAK